MNREQLDMLRFYTWQLQVRTLGELAEWRAQHDATTNGELLEAMKSAYNGDEYQD